MSEYISRDAFAEGSERMTLADRIIDYRAREDISQAAFAIRANVDRGVINKAENGKNISRLTEAKIELVLKGKGNDN